MIPIAFEEKKLLTVFLSGIIMINNQNSEGQKGSFKCSHTDSLTAEKEPTIGLFPDKANVK